MNLKNLDNLLLGCITILTLVWSLFYGLPSLMSSLLNTLLGNLILILSIVFVALYNPVWSAALSIVFFFMWRIVSLQKQEGYSSQDFDTSAAASVDSLKLSLEMQGFDPTRWSEEDTRNFVTYQQTVNRNKFFDVGILQQNTTQEELTFFLTNGMWPWDDETIHLYESAIRRNSYIQSYAPDSVIEARRVYPQFAIHQVLKMETPEGQFRTKGVVVVPTNHTRDGWGSFAYSSGQIPLENRQGALLYRCNPVSNFLEETWQKWFPGTPIQDYSSLEDKIPGLQFGSQGPCNPCLESCSFSLKGSKKRI